MMIKNNTFLNENNFCKRKLDYFSNHLKDPIKKKPQAVQIVRRKEFEDFWFCNG
jgi:hypothetical protein